MLILTFVANINDLVQVNGRYVFNDYDEKDCIDISHPNDTRGGLYLRKGARKSLDKMKRVLNAHIEKYRHVLKSIQRELDHALETLKALSVDSHIPYTNNLYIPVPEEEKDAE